MLGLQLLAVKAERDPGLVVGQVLQGQVGGVAAIGGDQREAGAGVQALQQGIQRHPFPGGAELGPVGDAVQVDGDLFCGQGAEAGPVPAPLLAGLAGDGELPVGEVDAGGRSGRQDREVLDQVLARGQLDAGTVPPTLEPARHGAHRCGSLV
jgi:hypothetical protein